MPHPLRLAVFDVDGTLIDSQHNIIAAMTEAWRVNGFGTPRPEAVRRIIGLSLVEAVATLMPERPSEDHLRVARSYKDAFFALVQEPHHREPLFPGTREALAALEAAGWVLGIATGKSQRGVRGMIERHDLEGVFVTIQTADENPGKPHPGMVLSAMGAVGARAEATVMIGDTTYDMEMARNARVTAVGVDWGYHSVEDLRAAGAQAMVGDYGDLPGLIEQLLKERECVSAQP